jgi:tetratricopeptide (TPR) repeat protein
MISLPGHARVDPIPAPLAVTPPAPVEEKKPAVVEEKKTAPVEMDAGAVATADAGASVAAADPADGGAVAAAEPPKPAKPKRPAEVSQAQLLHAVAISQVRRGESALEKGRADEALESFRAALENEGTLAVAFRGMGMAYAMQGNDTQALQAYQRYLQLAPSAADRGDIRRSIAELKARAKIGSGEK